VWLTGLHSNGFHVITLVLVDWFLSVCRLNGFHVITLVLVDWFLSVCRLNGTDKNQSTRIKVITWKPFSLQTDKSTINITRPQICL
jgi:galactose-1-phosphate uridylyltransferase